MIDRGGNQVIGRPFVFTGQPPPLRDRSLCRPGRLGPSGRRGPAPLAPATVTYGQAGWLEESPAGGLSHLTWWESGDCHNVDAWESEEAFGKFGAERLGPGMARAGVNVEPQVTFHPAHEVYAPAVIRHIA